MMAPPSPHAFLLSRVAQVKEGVSVLSDISVGVPARSFCTLCGPSGAGKSTLLRLLNRLDDPDSGTLMFMGRPIAEEPIRRLRQRVGFVFQTPTMLEGSVADNLAAAARYSGKPVPSGTEVVRMLETVELGEDFASRRAATLSGGEKQRVALARALVSCPEVLLLDEPTAALDRETAERLVATLAKLHRQLALTIVMVSHQPELVSGISDVMVHLAAGRLASVQNGTSTMRSHDPG